MFSFLSLNPQKAVFQKKILMTKKNAVANTHEKGGIA